MINVLHEIWRKSYSFFKIKVTNANVIIAPSAVKPDIVLCILITTDIVSRSCGLILAVTFNGISISLPLIAFTEYSVLRISLGLSSPLHVIVSAILSLPEMAVGSNS